MNSTFKLLLLIVSAAAANADVSGPPLLKGFRHSHNIKQHVISSHPIISGTSSNRNSISGISGNSISGISGSSQRPPLKKLIKLAIQVKIVLEAYDELMTLLERAANKGNVHAKELVNITDKLNKAKAGVSGFVLGKDLVDKLHALEERKEEVEEGVGKNVVDSARKVISGTSGKINYLG